MLLLLCCCCRNVLLESARPYPVCVMSCLVSRGVRRSLMLPVALIVVALLPQMATAQLSNIFGQAPAPTAASAVQAEVRLTAQTLEAGAPATLAITLILPPETHTYAVAPKFGGETRLTLTQTPGLVPAGDFQPDHPAETKFDENFGQRVGTFHDRVTWTRTLKITDPAAAQVEGTIAATYCTSGIGAQCKRFNHKFSVTLKSADAAATETPAAAEIPPATSEAPIADAHFLRTAAPQVGDAPGPVQLRMGLSPEQAAPGSTVTLTVTMMLAEGWHTYSLTQPTVSLTQPTVIEARATKIDLLHTKHLTPVGAAFMADQQPLLADLPDVSDVQLEQHAGTVTWSRQFRVTGSGYGVGGAINYLACNGIRCLTPTDVPFALGDLAGAGPVPTALPAEAGNLLAERFNDEPADTANLPWYLLSAFLGGLLLNVMPCVLPVVAIKVLSFVKQAGEDRGRVFALNAVYSVGVISVFLFLAALAALPDWFGWVFQSLGLQGGRFSWGGLFQSETFNIVMTCLVFAMGLSLLGLFEIPLPGMVNSAAGAHQREGLTGAFLTGVFATILATPCTGPFMTGVLTWSVKQPPSLIFLVWATMGLGMASPYLLFGLVPGAVKLLPKPGMWMIYFKQLAGFVLMGTVIYLMMSLKTTFIIPVLIGLLGLAVGLWMYGMSQSNPAPAKRRFVATVALLIAAGIGYFGYSLTWESKHNLDWQPFSTAKLQELRSDKRPILIDFTADWCPNCKVNEHIALNTAATKSLVERYGITPLLADFTDESPEIKDWLDRFGSTAIPLTVVFPAGKPNDPIILSGVYRQATLLEALEDAGATSNTAAAPAAQPSVPRVTAAVQGSEG